jgi:hypothetical protein
MKQFTEEELREYVAGQYDEGQRQAAQNLISRWLDRGDGAAIYENHDLGHPALGSCQITSFGSPLAQLETDNPPERLPDIGNQVNWRYVLVGTCRRNGDGK